MIVALEEAKAHLRVTEDSEDGYIAGLCAAASAAVLRYIGDNASSFLDTSGEASPILDSSDLIVSYDIPADIRHASLILIGEWFKNREAEQDGAVDSQYGYGYLPRPVVALLYPYRTPVLR